MSRGGRREGSGRKPEYQEPVEKILLRIPQSVLKQLDKYAKKQHLSRPKAVAALLEQAPAASNSAENQETLESLQTEVEMLHEQIDELTTLNQTLSESQTPSTETNDTEETPQTLNPPPELIDALKTLQEEEASFHERWTESQDTFQRITDKMDPLEERYEALLNEIEETAKQLAVEETTTQAEDDEDKRSLEEKVEALSSLNEVLQQQMESVHEERQKQEETFQQLQSKNQILTEEVEQITTHNELLLTQIKELEHQEKAEGEPIERRQQHSLLEELRQLQKDISHS